MTSVDLTIATASTPGTSPKRSADRRVITLDSNGAAPRAVTSTYLLGANGRPLPYAEAITGGIAPAPKREVSEPVLGDSHLARASSPASV